MARRKPFRWHIGVFLAPAVLVYTAIMIIPLFGTLNLSLYNVDGQNRTFVGLANFETLFGDPRWSESFWNALWNNCWFFIIHMLVQNPIGILLAALLSTPNLRMAAFYRTAIFIPTILSFVIVGFVWKLILSPIWGIAPGMLDAVGLKFLFAPWLGKEEYALTTLALISVWQFVGIPMMLIYAALLSIPDDVIEAAEMDGLTGWSQFWKIKLPLILPIPLSHLLRLPAATGRPPYGRDHRHRHVRHHPRGGLHLPLRHPDAAAPLSVLRGAKMSKTRTHTGRSVAAHAILLTYTLIALFPVFVIVINSFKSRRAIFAEPLMPPMPGNWDLVGYTTALQQGDFCQYFLNSMTVTVASLFFVLLFGAMAAFALSEYRFRGNLLMGLYLALGIMIPIRLGTVAILEMMVAGGLVNTLTALILVYTAQGLPLAVFILSEFMKQVSDDLKNAGRIDGLSEYTIFFRLVLPLVRPAMATVAVFTLIPIWNDLWFPLILAPAEATKTITLGSQVFIGQFVTNWNAVLAALSLAILPVLVLYLIFSRQLIRGITAGAVK